MQFAKNDNLSLSYSEVFLDLLRFIIKSVISSSSFVHSGYVNFSGLVTLKRQMHSALLVPKLGVNRGNTMMPLILLQKIEGTQNRQDSETLGED